MKKTILTALLLFAAAAVFAQSEYNFQRRSLFEKLPVTSKDIVFLGNSITAASGTNCWPIPASRTAASAATVRAGCSIGSIRSSADNPANSSC